MVEQVQHPAARTENSAPGPAFFTQTTDQGMVYAHNWVERPCFTILLPGHDWQLDETTADYIVFKRGQLSLKTYLADNRALDFAVGGTGAEGALRSFVASELDFVRPKFGNHTATPPRMKQNSQGIWALWRWEGSQGLRAGIGKGIPADQNHRIASLWIDPWVLSFDFATTASGAGSPSTSPDQIPEILESLTFHPGCFSRMQTGETWGESQAIIEGQAQQPAGSSNDGWE